MARRALRVVAVVLCGLALLGGPSSVPAAERMNLNVKNASVLEVLDLIAEAGEFDIVIGAGVNGAVTLMVDDMAPRDLLDVVVGVVDGAYVEEHGAIWVMTRQAYENRYGEPFVDMRVSRTISLRQAQLKDVLPSVMTLVGERAIVKPDLAGNVVTIKGSRSLVAEAAQMLAVLDRPSQTRSFPLEAIPSSLAADLLGRLLPERATIVEDPIHRRLLVSANEFDLDRAATMLEQLDGGEGIQSRVLDVAYANPDSLAEALRSHLTPDIGTCYSDARTGRLVVFDHPRVLRNVGELAAVLDVPQRQVLIEARILQVSTSREVRSGIDWSAVQDKVNIRGFFPELSSTESGVRGDFGDLTSQEYEVLVEALETFGETELLSSPRLMVLDGSEGHIHVGSQVPYKTIDTRETAAGTINQFEKVVVVDVGVKLEVSVDILGVDMVSLRIHPEVSSVTGFSDDIPIVDAATTESSLVVRDGNTVILGGLIKDEVRNVRKGIPILSSIPLIKYLVSSNSEEKLKSELVILLTPRIMTGREAYEGTGR